MIANSLLLLREFAPQPIYLPANVPYMYLHISLLFAQVLPFLFMPLNQLKIFNHDMYVTSSCCIEYTTTG